MTDLTKMASFDGERETYRDYKSKREGFKVINKQQFKGYFGVPRPHDRERVTQPYTVADDQQNDPTGARPGARVTIESEANYNRKDREWLENDVLWYYLQCDKYGTKAMKIV